MTIKDDAVNIPPQTGGNTMIPGGVSGSSLAVERIEENYPAESDASSPPAASVQSAPHTLTPPPLESKGKSNSPASPQSRLSQQHAKPISTGRPPLPPQPRYVVQPGGVLVGNQVLHRRVASTGDQSFVSVLTDAPSENSEAVMETAIGGAKHSRGVSWDLDNSTSGGVGGKHPMDQPSILQPVLSNEEVPSPVPPPERTNVEPTNTSPKVSLDDLIGSPLETEAENAIIEALERREQQQDRMDKMAGGRENAQQRSVKAGSTLLPAIPDDAVHVFEETEWNPSYDKALGAGGAIPEEQLLQADDSVAENGTEVSAPPSPAQNEASLSSKGETHESPPTRRAAFENMGAEKSVKELASELRRVQTGIPTDPSRRRYLQKPEPSTRPVSNADWSDRHSTVAPEAMIGTPGAEPVTSADVLVNNANILFRRSTKKKVGESGSDYDVESQRTVRPMASGHRKRNEGRKNWKKVLNPIAAAAAVAKKKDDEAVGTEEEITPSAKLEVEAGDLEHDNKQGSKVSVHPGQPISKQNKMLNVLAGVRREAGLDADTFREFIRNRRPLIMKKGKFLLVIVIPAVGVASLLFYGVGNPIGSSTGASYSWWILFLCVRQVITLSLSHVFEVLFIDFFSLRTRVTVSLWGPFITLMTVQARGWPYIVALWAILDLCMLYGSGRFAHHWLYWQDPIEMCNAENPSGEVVENNFYFRVLMCCIFAGVVTCLKRVWLAMSLGGRSVAHYGNELKTIMRKMVLLSEVALLAKEIADSRSDDLRGECLGRGEAVFTWEYGAADSRAGEDDDDDGSGGLQSQMQTSVEGTGSSPKLGLQNRNRNRTEGATQSFTKRVGETNPPLDHSHLDSTQKDKLMRMLDEWEEPEILSPSTLTRATVNDVLQYRQALSYMDGTFPFSVAFGPANTRENCIESAQKVYGHLLEHTPETEVLPFETISIVALDVNGELQQEKLRALIRIFRPDRDGNLTLLDFVKSCDSIYKSVRMFRAATVNSAQIDKAFESIVNGIFYTILICIILAILGLDPLSLFISLSSLVVAFAFMIGSASAKYFEGILLILVRKPYDIGDRISISDVDTDTNPDGSSTWFVEGVTLFTTTVRFATTNEVATYANGSLANSRIINAARSPKAFVYVYQKFGTDVPYEKVKIFKSAVESFVKARPREWISLSGFRATRVEADLGFIEYVIVVQHRESWQTLIPILQSKADLSSYCLEVSKKLEMRYVAPPLPVNLAINGNSEEGQREGQAKTSSDESSRVAESVGPRSLSTLGGEIDALFKPGKKKTG